MNKVVVSMLPVGQGAMNLIETYDNSGKMVNLSLIDCGTVRTKTDECVVSIKYVVEKMKLRAGQTNGQVFDIVMLTHRDSDHWNLFLKLFEGCFGQRFKTKDFFCEYMVEEGYIEGTEMDLMEEYSYRKEREECSYKKIIYCDENYYQITINHLNTVNKVDIKYYFNSINDPGGEMLLCYNIGFPTNFNNTFTVWLSIKDGSNYTFKHFDFKLEGKKLICLINNQKEFVNFSFSKPWEGPRTEAWWWQLHEDIYQAECRFIFQKLGVNKNSQKTFFTDLNIAHMNAYKTKMTIIEYLEQQKDIRKPISLLILGGNISQSGKIFSSVYKMAQDLSTAYVEAMAGREYNISSSVKLKILERMDTNSLSQIKSKVTKLGTSFTDAVINNATSVVSLLSGPKKPICLFTGDATCHTFYNIIVNKKEKDFQYLHNCVWTAPHHGAYCTMKGEVRIENNKSELYPIVLQRMKPKAMIVSAGFDNAHGHPHYSFMNETYLYLESEDQYEMHGVYYNDNDTNNADWWVDFVSILLFTNVSTSPESDDKLAFYNYQLNCPNLSPDSIVAKDVQSQWEIEYDLKNKGETNILPAYGTLEKNLLKTKIPDKQLFWHR